MSKEVEILKIGSIMPSIKDKDIIMVVYNGGPIFDYYVDILKEKCGDKYNYLKTHQAIVGTPEQFRSSLVGHKKVDRIKGIQNEEPKIGSTYSVGHWYTSIVNDIIEDCIIITKNSIYAIHNIEKIRNKKLNDLGI